MTFLKLSQETMRSGSGGIVAETGGCYIIILFSIMLYHVSRFQVVRLCPYFYHLAWVGEGNSA